MYNVVLKYGTRPLWDGGTAVSRRLQCTSFAGEAMEPLSSSGTLAPLGGGGEEGGEEEGREDGSATSPPPLAARSVAFGGDGAPAMVLLPGGAHALAPLRLSRRRPFATEFALVLEPGESFGWESYRLQEALDGDAPPTVPASTPGVSRGVFPTVDADAVNRGVSPGSGVPRLARVQRLYAGRGQFVSGTTSLLSAIDR